MKIFSNLIIFLLLSLAIHAGNDPKKWINEGIRNQVFIENVGQFDGRNWQKGTDIKYGVDMNTFYVFFTPEGLTYRYDKFIRNPKRSEGIHEPKRINVSELIQVTWLNANKNVEIISENPVPNYYSYSFKNPVSGEEININNIKAYTKLIYKNLYDKIDVEYEIYEGKGIKYNIIAHPGADLSVLKMKYNKDFTGIQSEFVNYALDAEGNLSIKTSLGDLTELKPHTYYKDSKKTIQSSFLFENDILSFNIENYDNSQEIIIDPWVIASTFASSTAVWEVETDYSGNVYVIGGESPMKLQKYSSAGALAWTYSTPWDTAGYWLGTLATDDVGNSYITAGTSPEIKKISNTGAVVWSNTGYNSTCEYWSITFNCDKTKLIVGGTYVSSPLSMVYNSAIFDIDITNGDVNSHVTFDATNITAFGATPKEVRSISSSKNAKYVFLTHNNVGAINQNIGNCPNVEPVFELDNGHHLGYKCENYLPSGQNGGGLKAIVANELYFYTHNGTQIRKRSLFDGSLITTVTLTGGQNQTVLGTIVVRNSGLAVDDCGNIYAGSTDRVVKFDQDLNVLADVAVPFCVYDVSVNSNGEVIAVGAQSNNGATNRNGKIQSISMSACAQFTLVCCDANICPVDTVCLTDPAFNLVVSSSGGTFTGPGITNATAGTFNPATAGIGTHTIYYTKPCGQDSVEITVVDCTPPEVCVELNGTLSASGGSGGPYTWQRQNTVSSCAHCTFGMCTPPICNAQIITTWVTYATGANVAPPTAYPIHVLDGDGNMLVVTSLSQLSPCSNCPTITVTNSSQTNPLCAGQTGSATVAASGGVTPYTFTWTGGLTGATQGSLNSGVYTVTASDANNCTGTLTVTIPNPTAISLTLTTSSPATCGNNNGSATVNATGGAGTFNYTWSTTPAQSGATASGLATGNYTVTATDLNSCTSTLVVNITGSNGLTLTMTSTNSSCAASDGSATVTVSGGTAPYNYTWTPSGGNNATANNLGAGNYTVIVTDDIGCTATGSAPVTSPNAPAVSVLTQTNVTCFGLSNGSVTLNVIGGTTPYTYTWSPSGGSSATASNLAAGTYNVSVNDNAGCTTPYSVTITQPVALSVTTSATPSSCGSSSGTATAVVSGGTNPYSYAWSPSGGSSATASGLASGPYTVVVSDNAGCTFSATATVGSPPAVTSTITNTAVSCFGGSDGTATVSPSAGTAPYTYTWNDPASQVTQTASGLTAGNYSCVVTDNQGCTISMSTTVASPAMALNANLDADDVNCTGQSTGNATVTPSGGTPPYNFLWTGGQTTSMVLSLSVGTHCVTVTDAHSCTWSGCVDITQPTPMVLTVTPVDATCYGVNNGQASATVTGGTPPHTWLWSVGSGASSLTNLLAGSYTVIVTDANNCTQAQMIQINQPPQLAISVTGSQVICSGSQTSLAIYPVGGIFPYTYFWNGAQSGSSITVNPTTTTTYTAYVTDANGCQSEFASTTITLYPDIVLTASVMPDSICPGESVVIAISVSGGPGAPYQVIGSDNQYISSPYLFYPNESQTFIVTATDDCNQSEFFELPIHVYPQPPNAFLADTVRGCDPLTVQFNEFSADSGQTYVWDFGDNSNLSLAKNPVHTYTTSGTFDVTLTVTSVNNCKTVNVVEDFITVYPKPLAAFTYYPELVYQIKPIVSFTNISQMSTSYIWHFGTGDSTSHMNPTYLFPGPGSFNVSLIAFSDQGCSDTVDANIDIREQFTFYAPTAFSPDNDGSNEYFRVYGSGIKEEGFTLMIFDRWGEKVFEADKMETAWDGRIKDHLKAPLGTYTWLCIFHDVFNNRQEEAGTVTLIR